MTCLCFAPSSEDDDTPDDDDSSGDDDAIGVLGGIVSPECGCSQGVGSGDPFLLTLLILLAGLARRRGHELAV